MDGLGVAAKRGNPKSYRQPPIYHQVSDYLREGKTRMDELGVAVKRRKAFTEQVERYKLPLHLGGKYLL